MFRSNRLLTIAFIAAASIASTFGGANSVTCYGQPNCSLGTEPYTFGPNDVFGGGSSGGAPWWRQVGDCYASPADLVIARKQLTYVDTLLFDYKGGSPQNCQTTEINPGPTTWFTSTGSGRGILGFFGHDPVSFWGPVNEANGTEYFPRVSYALSGVGLTRRIVSVYDQGTGRGSFCVQKRQCIAIAAPAQISCTSGSTNPYPNALYCYGPIVQFPLSVDPIAMFYTHGGVYEKVSGSGKKEIDYVFNVQNGTKNGGLRLSVASLCGIYNGAITNWNDPSLTSDNGGVSLEDPQDPTPAGSWNVPLLPVGRSDASGATLAFTRHLAKVCSAFGFNIYKRATLTLPVRGEPCSSPAIGQIIVAAGSTGVALCVNFAQSPNGQGNKCSAGTILLRGYTDCIQQGRIGYISADYVLPYVSKNGMNSYGLFAADIENAESEFVAPSAEAASIGFEAAGLPPQTDAKGHYCRKCGKLKRKYPWDWNPQALLADPSEPGAYPIVGTTNFLGYSCYASADVLANLLGELNYIETAQINAAGKGILESSGVAALPKVWRKAIEQTFVSNGDSLGLQMTTVGGSATCSISGIIGA